MTAFSLTARDGVRLDGHRYRSLREGDPYDLCFVVAHGFTLNHLKPDVLRVAQLLRPYGGVVTMTFRGHGSSGGEATFGLEEIEDLRQLVAYARELGYRKVVTVGWSMGSGNVLLHGAAIEDGAGAADAVVSVSGAARWYLRDTTPMKRVQWLIGSGAGLWVARTILKTRIAKDGWGQQRENAPLHPYEAIARIAPRPVLVVHGDQDAYFTLEQPHTLYDAAREPKELWVIPGYGHAESSADEQIVSGIGERARRMVDLDPVRDTIGR